MIDWLRDNVLAAVATLIASGHLIWAIIVGRKDSPKVHLKYQTNMSVHNHPAYKKDITYLVLSVINRGRRPVTISTGGYGHFDHTGGIFTDSLMHVGPRVLDEKTPSTDFFLEEHLIDLSIVQYFFAKDTADRVYELHLHRFSWFWKHYMRLTNKRTNPTPEQ